MDKLVAYREYIKILLKKYGEDQDKPEDSVVTQTVIDEERDHYHLFHAGWNNGYRIYGCYLHFDIINNKIWLQHNGTEMQLASELVEMGVPKQDIVLGFHSPFRRQFSGYAVE